jgi:ATP-dependent helicase/nuclease subunit B
MGEDISATRTAVKIKRLTRAAVPIIDGLCDEFEKTKFKPRFFELKIEGNNELTPDPIKLRGKDGKAVYIYGIIDRVDTYEENGDVYVRVIDYKTGAKDFSPEDIEKGRNLQMFLYLKAIIESDKAKFRESLGLGKDGKIIPAGVIYVKTSLADAHIDRDSDELALDAVKKNQLREGMTLDGDMNDALMGEDYIPGKNKREAAKYRYSEEGFDEIMQKVEDSVLRISEGIKSGRAEAEPNLDGTFSPCDFCEYKPVCRNVKVKK